MQVLIADKFEQSGVNGLKKLGYTVDYQPDLKDAALAERLAKSKAEVLVVRSTKVAAEAMPASLKLIVRAGAGVNTIDVKAATTKGIRVANCPGKNAIAVAELAFGLILALDRRIPDNVADLRAGSWNKKEYSKARGLYGATLGLLGAGSIAAEMIHRAAGFGMPVVLWSRRYDGEDRPMTRPEADALGCAEALARITISLAPSAEEVAARSQVLSIHLALAPETKQLVGERVLRRLAPGSLVVNTARGEVVDHVALRRAIQEKDLRVALDVFANEPAAATGDFTDEIARIATVYGTHHIGASTDQAQEAIAAETVRIIQTFCESGAAPNAVN